MTDNQNIGFNKSLQTSPPLFNEEKSFDFLTENA